ncbi:glycine betaine ABC transporter substrate-binding protein [Oleidesulfovibrio sp.]|uniref:glycine betaine ABC transporter substrate-binding protein n=1 Tax=Oleidesulfovibrio sp. TaxID=2909707 RepID=UPI003A83D8E8
MRRFVITLFCFLFLATSYSIAGERPLTIAYVEWSSIASANLVQVVVQEELNVPCRIVATDAENMWRMVATGKADVMLSAWLPATHSTYYDEFGAQMEDLGPNLKGTRTGLIVPKVTAGRFTAGTGLRNRPYITTESIPGLLKDAEKYNHRIIGIDSGAGVMEKTRTALKEYGLEGSFRLVEGSEVSMMAELSHAIRHQRWIVVTGWLPHWAFARWQLEFLEDPKGVYADGGNIHTFVRKGLKEDQPELYALLDSFYWTPEDMGQLMLWIQDDKGLFPYEKAQRWLRTHPERVAGWLQ